MYNLTTDVTELALWSIIVGSQYATINPSNGKMVILSNANNSSVTIQAIYGNLTATKEITLTYVDGSSSETTTETSVDESGNTTTITTTVTTNEDGSSSQYTETSVVDSSGNTIGSSESNKETNVDGSYEEKTVNYDADGNAVDGTNVSGDTDGNVDTQDVEYDEQGNTTVVGYDIDTSGNPDGVKHITTEEVATEFYAFDTTRPFELLLHFKFVATKPPQTENQATILNAKRADPTPWYGFDIRRNSNSGGYVEGGVCFYGSHKVNGASKASGTTTRTAITKNADSIYKIKVNYDPTVESGNTFVMYDMINEKNIFVSDGRFPDLIELRYLDITIGCGLDTSGLPHRRAIVDVYEFYVKKK